MRLKTRYRISYDRCNTGVWFYYLEKKPWWSPWWQRPYGWFFPTLADCQKTRDTILVLELTSSAKNERQ